MTIRISNILTIKVTPAGSAKMPWMTPLRIWAERHGFTYNTAAAALGISRSTYRRLLHKETLPKLVQLAMKRIDDEKGMK